LRYIVAPPNCGGEFEAASKATLLGGTYGDSSSMPMDVLSAPAVLAMHAPDGLFSMPVNIVFAVVTGGVVAGALANLLRRSDHRLAPTMGVMAAFVFAAQMVNFPIASGTTGHLLGGTLAAILLGPWAGTVVMAVVILFQAMLGDGGTTTLGPNVFNMGIVGSCLAYYGYLLAVGRSAGRHGRVVSAAFFSSWLSVVLASAFVSVQLAVSGTASLHLAFAAMVVTHMAIGVGEALITAGVVAFLLKTRPELIYDRHAPSSSVPRRLLIAGGLGASLAVGGVMSLLPTLWDFPDGLESVGIAKGLVFEEPEQAPDGSLAMLAAYPIGVRLEMKPEGVVASHRYERQGGAVQTGDVVVSINGVPTPDLKAAAEALGCGEEAKSFKPRAGEAVAVVVRRDGRQMELRMTAAAGPVAGTETPLLALLPDYTVPGVGSLMSTSLAGLIGTLAVFLVSFGVGRLFTRPGRLEVALKRAEEAGGARS
jgi:cobalt/nickel transport system permease protein